MVGVGGEREGRAKQKRFREGPVKSERRQTVTHHAHCAEHGGAAGCERGRARMFVCVYFGGFAKKLDNTQNFGKP